MDLAPEQYFVYAWRYTDDTVCKLGVEYAPKFLCAYQGGKDCHLSGY